MFVARAITLTGLAVLATARAPAAQDAAPVPDLEHAFEARLSRHPYFSKIAYERVARDPYIFLVQKADGAANRAATLAAQYVLLLDPVLELFEREIATPLGLPLRPDHASFLVALLASPGDLENYQRVTDAPWHLGTRGHFDRALGAVVLCEDPFQPGSAALERARSARHLFLHACQAAWYTGGPTARIESWLMEGMADFYARRDAPDASAKIDSRNLHQLVVETQDERTRWTNLRTLEELVSVADPTRLDALFRTRTPKELGEIDTSESWWAFYRQSSLLFQFLWEADDARRRPALIAFLGHAFAGHAEWRTLGGSFAPVTAAELEQDFLGWVMGEHRSFLPGIVFDEAGVKRALARAPGDWQEAVDPGATPLAAPLEPTPITLDLADATAEERLALAIHGLSRGDAQSALAELDRLLAEPLDSALHVRVERERRRAAAWIRLRDGTLSALVAGTTSLEFTLAGKKQKARILAIDAGELVLDKSRSGVERLRIDALAPLELAQQMKPAGGADDWARLVPYVLGDDPRWKKLLKEDGGEASALLEDARGDYPARLRLGEAAARIQALHGQSAPRSPAEVDQRLEVLRSLRQDFGDLDLIQRKHAALRTRAGELLGQRIDLVGPQTMLAGKLEVLEGERIRLTYTFDDARELADFSTRTYPQLLRKALGPENVDDVPFHVERGKLTALGQAYLQSLVQLAAPLTVDYSLEFAESDVVDPNFNFALGICDDGAEHFLWAISLAHLQLYDVKGSDHVPGQQVGVFPDSPYAMELRHDGRRATLFCEGKEQGSIGVGTRQSGGMFLCANNNHAVRIESLSIEGHLTPASFTRLRQAWIEAELAKY